MSNLSCCPNAEWLPELDLPQAAGFDFLLGKCARCGTHWMNVFCIPTSITGYERVSPQDVAAIRAMQNTQELKRFLRQWSDTNL